MVFTRDLLYLLSGYGPQSFCISKKSLSVVFDISNFSIEFGTRLWFLRPLTSRSILLFVTFSQIFFLRSIYSSSCFTSMNIGVPQGSFLSSILFFYILLMTFSLLLFSQSISSSKWVTQSRKPCRYYSWLFPNF